MKFIKRYIKDLNDYNLICRICGERSKLLSWSIFHWILTHDCRNNLSCP